MTITPSLFRDKRPALQRAFRLRLRATQAALFQNQRTEARLVFFGLRGWASVRNGRADEQGRFPGSSLLSSALASKDQAGSPGHASRLFALGSIPISGQSLLGPNHHRDRGHP